MCCEPQYALPRVTEAHPATRKVAAFSGYSVEQQSQCKAVAEQYIRELTTLRAKFMSRELMAVGDPSLLPPAPAEQEQQPAQAQEQTTIQAPQGSSALGNSTEPDTEPESSEPEEWDTGEGWEIPQM